MRMLSATIAICLLASSGGAALPAKDAREARAVYEQLVSFPTVAGRGEVPKLVDWLVDYLEKRGLPREDIAVLPHKDTRALLVRLRGSQEQLRPVMFSGHLDVVEARREDWETDPFRLVERGGAFYGRGAYDNKAGAAAMLSALLRLHDAGRRLRRTLVFAFPGDEETALETAGVIAAHPWVHNAEFAINTDAGHGLLSPDGRPLIYLVQAAEKTYESYEISVTNPGGHSSRPRVDNALYDMGDVLVRLRKFRMPPSANALSRAYLGMVGKVLPGEEGVMLRRFAANPDDAEAAAALFANPEYVGSTRTTCVPTLIKGGHAENALPQSVTVTVNCRIFPSDTPDLVRDRLAAAIDDPRVAVKKLYDSTPSPVSEMRPDVTSAIKDAIHAAHPGVPVAPYMESGATDGRVYRSRGIATYGSSGVFYPSGSANLHGKDEHIPVKDFYEGVEHVYSLALTFGAQ